MFEELKDGSVRLCKIINKQLVKGNKIQINMHDGTNVLSNEKNLSVGDSVYLDSSGKIKKIVEFKKGAGVIVAFGKHLGKKGKIDENKDKTIIVSFKDGGSAEIAKMNAFVE